MRIRMNILFLALPVLLVLLVPLTAAAQQTVNPSDIEFLPVGQAEERPARPWEPYNILFHVELGGQVVGVDGNKRVYDAHQNYQDGLRVFGFKLQGDGQQDAFFSRFLIEGGGWGNNEPYNWTNFGFTKDRIFDFSGKFRQSRYDWVFPGFARDQHFNHTERRMQNYNLTILPKRPFRIKAGYSRNSSFGPSFTTLDYSRGEFPLVEPIRQTHDEYRIGVEGNLSRWFFSFGYGYRYFRNDRFLELTEFPAAPNDPADAASLSNFFRINPSTGKIPFYRINIAGRPHPTVEVSTRLVYSRAETNFTRAELYDGTTYSQGPAVPSVPILADYTALGSVTRPMTTADANFTWRPNRFLTITNNAQYSGYDIAGFQDSNRDVTCGAISASCSDGLFDLSWDTFFDLDTVTNRTEARLDFSRKFGVRGGFRYLKRDYRFNSLHEEVDNGVPQTPSSHAEDFDFSNRSFLAGANYRAHRRAGIFFNMEVGDNTRVFTRLGPASLDRYRLRGQFEPLEGLRLNASWFMFDNNNKNLPIPNPDFVNGVDPLAPETLPGSYDSQNRGFAFDFQYGRDDRGYVNAGYSRNDISTRTDVVYYAGGFPSLIQNGVSVYTLDDNYLFFDAGARLGRGFYVDGGYRLTDSAATFPPSDPLAVCVPIESGQCDDTGALGPLENFDGGLKYHQPHLSFRYAASDNVTWKGGWRYYKYDQIGGTLSDYKANVVAGSVVLRF